MIRRADPDAVEAEYLRGLNLSFPGWGGREMFDWCFRRCAGGPGADLFVAAEGGRLIAGSALTYRRARRRGRYEAVGIMTGSWTAPEARGRGLFKAMIQASRTRAAEQGCRLLLGFGRLENPSSRGLASAGFERLAVSYLQSPIPHRLVGWEAVALDDAEAAFRESRMEEANSCFVYEPAEWRGQFLSRPHTVSAIRVGPSVALVERAPGRNALLDVATADPTMFVDTAIAGAASLHPLSAYAIEGEATERLRENGFSAAAGAVHMLTLDGPNGVDETWRFANGDRM